MSLNPSVNDPSHPQAPSADRLQTGGTTIAAIATAIVPQQGSVGIIRLSGSQSLPIAQGLFHGSTSPWESHRIYYGLIRDPHTQEVVDEALLLVMKAPRSYTREDVVEFHCHGGMMVVQRVLQLCVQAGAELAQPGEFTLRAFLNGRIDLTQAESIADLVGAQSPQAAQTALAGLQGKLAQPLRQSHDRCLDLLAEIEARIDFEEDLPPLDLTKLQAELQQLYQDLQRILATAHQGELLRTGLKVAIVGRPNVGKSSLLNAWSQSDRAIVTPLPGTTRDVVESQLVVRGIPVQVLDTAGIRQSSDWVEQLGIDRSRQAAAQADLILLTLDAGMGWTEEDTKIYQDLPDRPLIVVWNKIDLRPASSPTLTETLPCALQAYPVVHTAAAHHQGIEALEAAIVTQAHQGKLTAANLDFAINQRQATCLTQACQALDHLQQTIVDQLPLDFWSIDLREAIHRLGEITGESLTESMLDRIFSRFCMGK
ncbi:MAG: tRNA uridine-5-carboxymethylaminomethyl(34) synthesis GTPase MnmE [Prochlorotrichaceae cyanobacterium]